MLKDFNVQEGEEGIENPQENKLTLTDPFVVGSDSLDDL